MAFYEDDGGGNSAKFLRINGNLGSIVAKADVSGLSDAEKEKEIERLEGLGYIEFKTKNPQTDAPISYYVKQYKGGVEGRIVGLERVELEASKVFGYNLHMEDDEGAFSIFFNDDRPTTQRLLKTYENIDLDNEVRIKVFKDEKGYAAIEFRQNGKSVPQKWVGGQDGNLPQPKKSKGKWDYSPVDEFLYENAMKNIVPNYKKPEKASAATASTEATATGDTDDIPF
jgi:hypothetical protein